MRAKSVQHAEYEILNHIVSEIDLSDLKDMMCNDKHSTKRFDTACENIIKRLDGIMATRTKHLPKEHADYTKE
ncbi:MAG: hypothetical protein CMF52_09310 [Legionellales bacterium]|nr:hypothetical protein [Legionellales bacterium]|tara:strand:- start:42 stop:260 length:219 start_codon:yes stop_codon:yes gene_type:complete